MTTTSVMARDQHERSGRLSSNCEKVREVIAEHDGLTSGEIGNLCGLPSEEAGRRACDLEKLGLCYADGKARRRRCAVKGSTMQTWWRGPKPTTQGELF